MRRGYGGGLITAALLLLLLCLPGHSLERVSQLEGALAGQGFQLSVTAGGAAELKASTTGERTHSPSF